MGSKHSVQTLASEAPARQSQASSVEQQCLSELCDVGTAEPSCSVDSAPQSFLQCGFFTS